MGLFPLNLVVFPGEQLNLHIFEPRYKQLINDCLEKDSTFGIPSFVNQKVEMGTEVQIDEVSKRYSDGRMDIKTSGLQAFDVVDFQNPWNDKLYGGGKVRMIEYDDREDAHTKTRLIDLSQQLFSWLKMEDSVSVNRSTSLHEIIHKIGLRPEEEYEVFKMESESERHKFVVQHLKRVIPALERAEKAKERIQMNGHFKHLDPLQF